MSGAGAGGGPAKGGMRSVLAEVQLNRGGDLLPRPATVAKPTRQGVAHAGTEGGARGKENRRGGCGCWLLERTEWE